MKRLTDLMSVSEVKLFLPLIYADRIMTALQPHFGKFRDMVFVLCIGRGFIG